MFVILQSREALEHCTLNRIQRIAPLVKLELWNNFRPDRPRREDRTTLDCFNISGDAEFEQPIECKEYHSLAIRIRFVHHELFVEDTTFSRLFVDGHYHVAADLLDESGEFDAATLIRRAFPESKQIKKAPSCYHRSLNHETSYRIDNMGETYQCNACGVWVFTYTNTCSKCDARYEAIIGIKEDHCHEEV